MADCRGANGAAVASRERGRRRRPRGQEPPPAIMMSRRTAVEKARSVRRRRRLFISENESPFLCRFLDAGITSGATCSGGRRPKSARARSRGKFGRRAGSQRYGDLIFAPVMMVGAKLARGDLDRVGSGAWKRAIGISVVAWSVSTGDRLVDWRGCGERDRRRRGAGAMERESGCAHRRCGS